MLSNVFFSKHFSSEKGLLPLWLNFSFLSLFTLFVVFRLYARDVFSYFEPFFYILILYAFYRYSPQEIRRFGWVIFPALTIPILSWCFMLLDFPDIDPRGARPEDLLDKFIFIYIGFFLFLNKDKINFLLMLSSFVILLIPFVVGYGLDELRHGVNGRRVDFGLVAIRSALLFGLVLIGFICFGMLSGSKLPLRFLLLAITPFCFFIVLLTQTRSAVVGLVVSFCFMLILILRSRISLRKFIVTSSILFFSFVLALNAGFFEPVVNRFKSEAAIITTFVESHGDMNAIPKSSIGLRLKFWQAAVDYGLERPMFGWGYKGGDLVMEMSGVISKKNTVLNTVHNGFLELFVRYGLLGFALVLGCIATILFYFYRAVKCNLVPGWLSFFVPVSLVYFSVVAMFTSDLFYWQSLYAYNIIMAVAAAYAFDYLVKNKGGNPDGG